MAAKRKNYTVDTRVSGLNLREKPTKDAAILSLLPNGAAVTIDPAVEVPEGWAAVKGGGYVMREFLK